MTHLISTLFAFGLLDFSMELCSVTVFVGTEFLW